MRVARKNDDWADLIGVLITKDARNVAPISVYNVRKVVFHT